jgi:hypothetical protein
MAETRNWAESRGEEGLGQGGGDKECQTWERQNKNKKSYVRMFAYHLLEKCPPYKDISLDPDSLHQL